MRMAAQDSASGPLRLPRVPPLEVPVGRVRQFFLLAKNPLLSIPAVAYEEPIVVPARPSGVAYVCAPHLVGEVLLDRRDEFPKDGLQKRILSPLTGNGILTAEGEDWRWQRRTVAGLFRHSDILDYVPAMVAGAESALAHWRDAPPGEVHAVDRHMVSATYHVIAHTILPSDHAEVTATIEQGAAAFAAGMPWAIASGALNLPLWMPHPGKRALRRQTAELRRLVAGMIAARRQQQSPQDDLFNRLLATTDPETGRELADEQLVDNLLTFLLAGHDTTSRALTWSLYLLSRSPEWAERLRAEVDAVAGGRAVARDDVAQLVLTRQFVNEAMRLFPPVPTITRIAAVDTELAGHPIPAGTLIVIPVYVVHRHRLLWKDPDVFDPSRFAPGLERTYPRNQFMPFGAGPRVCIGAAFATIEATVVLASLVRAADFDWAGEEDVVPVSRIVLVPQGGMPMRVALR
ncbi:MAG: cytochrome P450 [Bauldia sp.]|nr:cytochrome P450 [Bauldia sp.]